MRYDFKGVTKDTAFQITEVVDKWRLAGLKCKAIAASTEFTSLYDVFVSGSGIAIMPMGEDGFKFEHLNSTETLYIHTDDLIELSIS